MSPADACSRTDCTSPRVARGLCNKHYLRAKKAGEFTTGQAPMPERFWARTRRVGECLEWTGGQYKRGYGRFYTNEGTNRQAHRVAWELANGPIPDGMVVRHRCDNPPCVDPAHLELGTQEQNIQDAVDRRRYRHGDDHPFRMRPELVARGETRTQAKLTDTKVREIRARAAAGESGRSLAREFGVSASIAGRIIRRERWTHVEQ